MSTIIYESGADYRATAERHFRRAEEKMLDCFKNIEKGYTAEIDGWNLVIKDKDEIQKINLMYTCQWEVYWLEDSEIAVIKVDIKGKKYELIFSAPMLFEVDNKIWFVGMRKNKEGITAGVRL